MENVVYSGLFLDEKSRNQMMEYGNWLVAYNLGLVFVNISDNFHVTFDIGDIEPFPEELIGREFSIWVTGFGGDDNNIGFKVELPDELKPFFKKDGIPHITFALSDGASAKDTAKLDFYDFIFMRIEAKARLGYFTRDGQIVEAL